MNDTSKFKSVICFLWTIADLLNNAFQKSGFQKIILPFIVLHNLDYALQEAKAKVLEAEHTFQKKNLANSRRQLCRAAGYACYNTSKFTYNSILHDDASIIFPQERKGLSLHLTRRKRTGQNHARCQGVGMQYPKSQKCRFVIPSCGNLHYPWDWDFDCCNSYGFTAAPCHLEKVKAPHPTGRNPTNSKRVPNWPGYAALCHPNFPLIK